MAISRSSLYYQKRPRGSWADRIYDERIVMACGEKLAYGYLKLPSINQKEFHSSGELIDILNSNREERRAFSPVVQ